MRELGPGTVAVSATSFTAAASKPSRSRSGKRVRAIAAVNI